MRAEIVDEYTVCSANPTIHSSLVDSRVRRLGADGVYAAWYIREDGTQYPAAVNIGKRPTFYDYADRSLIEAHLIGFRGDLYGEIAKVRFVRRLRGEKKFEGIEQLQEQLGKDVADAAKYLED